MSIPYAVRVNQLAKSYIITHEERPTTLGEAIGNRIRQPLKRFTKEEFWALRGVSFDIQHGEVVGIIGRNGAGKSTLLKILSRIVSPTKGDITMNGRVGSLLEVGTGFHPELTGRENIFLNGSILGMRHREIEHHFDAIVDFSGVEQFLDTPVKRYSSGMYVRLAFAVAAHLRSDILIIDEVLAVGDAAFQEKCLNKMQSIASDEGRTILFVSHNMISVQSLCTRCILLQQGQIAYDGQGTEASERYLQLLQKELQTTKEQALSHTRSENSAEFDVSLHDNPYRNKSYFQKITLLDAQGHITSQIGMGEALTMKIEIAHTLDEINMEAIALLRSEKGHLISRFGSFHNLSDTKSTQAQREQFILSIPQLPLTPGTYTIDLLLRSAQRPNFTKLDRINNLISLTVQPRDIFRNGHEFTQADGLIYIPAQWKRLPLQD